MPVIFISYTHDSDDHRKNVASLAERLRKDGFETRLDQYLVQVPAKGWSRWLVDQLHAADFVLVVCTGTYYSRFRGHESPRKGKGVDWEGSLISYELYQASRRTLKFVPILFSDDDAAFIPEPLRVQTAFLLTSEKRYADLLDFLSGTVGVAPVPVGTSAPRKRRPAGTSEVLPPLENPHDFESLCLDLWREIWGDSGAQRNGRSGQPQAGVDVFGVHNGDWMGVQCKQKNSSLRTSITVHELEKEVAAARGFKPPLNSFVLATAGPRDRAVQERARELSSAASFKVEVWGWDEIWAELVSRQALLARIYPVYWPQLARLGVGPRSQQKIATSRLPRIGGELFGRDSRLEELEAAWEDERIHIVTLVAWGGMGKTSLVARFADLLAARGYDGADYFDWSFYSQGASATSNASGDAFVDAALRFFRDAAMADSPASAWDKGARLAAIVAKRRTLLVLDGLEPLQHPPGPLAGDLKDPAVQAFLRGLAQVNSGLCLVTTRERVTDLEKWEKSAAPCWRLEQLSNEAGVELLKSLGVRGAETELAAAVREVQGHALTVSLLGRFLKSSHGGDVRRRDRVDFSDLRSIRGGEHAFRVIAAYENWLGDGSEAAARQLALLRLLGLFDRLAANELLAALRAPPAIAGLTEPLVGLDEVEWSLLVAELEEAALVVKQEAGLDAHPLIREYFGERLRGSQENAWREAHGRLFDFLAKNTDYQPEGLTGLQPLYEAIFHGSQAGRHEEACSKIYVDRIQRGPESFSTRKLGAFGADLRAVACFFEKPWSRLAPSLSETTQAWLLNEAAFRLRALGRLREAIEPMRAGLSGAARLEAWKDAAARASNLSELELTLGEVKMAVADAEQSVIFADRSSDAIERITDRITLADARHQAGDEETALALFREAERLQAERQPQYPLLYSLQGFQYCDLLLARAERAAGSGRDARTSGGQEECDEVERRAAQALKWAINHNWLLDVALNHLSLGRARLYRSILKADSPSATDAGIEIEQAVAGLRAAGHFDYIPRGLLTRAWLRWLDGNADGSRADLDEAQEIAERGSMKLHLADVALYRARLFHDRVALAQARRMIEECDYGRRLPEIEDLEGAWSDDGIPLRRRSQLSSPTPDSALSDFAVSQTKRALLAFRLVVARQASPSLLQHLNLAEIQAAAAKISTESSPGDQLVDALGKLEVEQPEVRPSPIWLAWLEQKDKVLQ
jgi:hypothetical protein